jgi:hypothetical protein
MRRATFLLAFFVAAAVVGVLYLRSPHLPASLPLSPAAGGPIYVLESSVPSINAGKVYALTDTIIIPDGTSIRAVMPSGKTQTIRGPYSGPASDLAKGHRSNEGVIAWIKKHSSDGRRGREDAG